MIFFTGRGSGIRSMGPTFWLLCSVLLSAVAFARAGAQISPQLPEPPDSAASATNVGEETCLTCHDDKKASFRKTLHSKAADPRTPAAGQGCESCHGPGSKHADDPEKFKPRQFNKIGADEASAVCTTCHASGEHALWAGSKHEARRVACTTCHSVHSSKGPKLMKTETQPKLCATCHQNIVNKLNRFDHMPVREDKLVCSSCHNTHGSANVKLLKAGTTVDQACELPRRKARTAPLGTRAGRQFLRDLPRSARIEQRSHARVESTLPLPALPRHLATPTNGVRRVRHEELIERQQNHGPWMHDLPLADPWIQFAQWQGFTTLTEGRLRCATD